MWRPVSISVAAYRYVQIRVYSWMKLCFMVNENGNIPVRRWWSFCF